MPRNPSPESRILRFGPYAPPRGVRPGDEIVCEIRGKVVVRDWSDRPGIMWPRAETGLKPALILCGDLVRAIRMECQEAVGAHWGVAAQTVSNWKRAMGIDTRAPGALAVLSAKTHEQMAGKPAHPNTKAGLLRAASRPKPDAWVAKAIEWLREADRRGLKRANRQRYLEGAGTPQCPICGRFATTLRGHACLRGARVVDGQLQVPGVATPYRLCAFCEHFKAPDEFPVFASQPRYGVRKPICRKCRSIRELLARDRRLAQG